MNLTPGLDVIILAGGRGSRMEGRDKAALVVDGERLIDTLLDEVSMAPGLMQVVVVTGRGLEVHPGVKVAAEEPPFAGPVAAIAAGASALAGEASAQTAVLAVDAPESGQLIPDLLDALGDADVAAVRSDDHLQPLCAVWDTTALHRVLDGYDSLVDQPAKSLFEAATVTEIDGDGSERDYDTLDEIASFGDVEL